MSKECVKLGVCPFFQDRMQNTPATAELIKKRYCLGDNSDCARWLVLQELGPQGVPSDLFPNQQNRVQSIIESSV